MQKLCLVVNPIAGMGGAVGLKGTDGVVGEALRRGASPRAHNRAREALERLREAYTRHRLTEELTWFTAGGEMGERILGPLLIPQWHVEVVHAIDGPTTAEDTKATVKKAMARGCELIVFCGGDGTARDVLGVANGVPMFGIPSGVKMHSGVFAVDPPTAGELLEFYIKGDLTTGEGEVMDLDEELYRRGEWNIRLFGVGITLYEPSFVQAGKSMVEEDGIEDNLAGISEDIKERVEGDQSMVLVLGPGGTLARIGKELGIDKTLLGVDVVGGGSLICKDCDETSLLAIVEKARAEGRKVLAVVSPIGGQGFFLGRGNLQLSPMVVRLIGPDNLLVVSVPQKLEGIAFLRVDTGDHDLDSELRRMQYIRVLTGYRTYRLKGIQ